MNDGVEGSRANPARRGNQAAVLEILRRDGAASQAHLARETGLSRATVHNIVKVFADEGIATILDGANGRETTVALVAARGTIVALDFGHQRIHGSVMSFDSSTRHDLVIQLDREHAAEIDVDAVADLVERLLGQPGVDRDQLLGVCVGIHAPLDVPSGKISPSAILPGWGGLDIRRVLEERLGTPVHVDNDANLAALAEWTWGAGRGNDDFLYVKSSNGIGAGLVLGGRVYRGGTGMAGELGHIVVDERGQLCNCGNRGCLSALASGRSLLAQLRAAGNDQPTLRAVIQAAVAGDAACVRVLQEAGRYIGIALTHAVKVVAPRVIAIGGELAAAGPIVLDAVRAELQANMLKTAGTEIEIREGLLRGDMCLLGGVAFVLEREGSGLSALPDWILEPRFATAPTTTAVAS